MCAYSKKQKTNKQNKKKLGVKFPLQFKVDRLQIILVAKNIYLRVATVHQ